MSYILLGLLVLANMQAGQKSFDDLPPALPSVVKTKKTCKVPPWLVHLPPGMEQDYKDCVNDTFRPTKRKAQHFLKYEFNKNAVFASLHVSKEFHTRVYRIRYTLDGKSAALLCNEKIDYCVKDQPIGKIKKGKHNE